MNNEDFERRRQYLLLYQSHLDRFIAPLSSQEGKRMLILGCGDGAEALCLLRRGRDLS